MATFVYKAKKSTAETVTGTISADSQDEAIDLINQLGLLPVAVEAKTSDDVVSEVGRPQKVKTKDIFIFSRQMASLLKSGISLLRALHIIESQTQNKYFKRVISKVAWDVKNGRLFSESLADFPHLFSNLYITMTSAGEESGNLQEMLVNVTSYQKRQEEILSKVKMSLAYPALMFGVGCITIYFILTYVLPKMAGLFTNMQEALPIPTIILLGISEFLSQHWAWILLIVFVIAFIIQRSVKLQKGKAAFGQFLLRLPLFGEIILKTELSRFSRTLVLLLNSGVTILRALDISIPILSNEIIKAHLLRCKENLTAGGSFGEGIQESKEIPEMMGHLIAVGEESGNLTEVLTDIANDYEQETNDSIKLMTTLFEPFMILTVGLIVGFIVFAMLLPIFQVDVLSG